MEHLMCKNFDHLQEDFDKDGIDWNAYTSSNEIVFYLTGLDEKVNKWKGEFMDLLGEFSVPAHTQETLEEAKKKHGLRVHGLLVSNGYHGSYGMSSMRSLCDPVHVFRDWSEIRGL